MLAWGPPLSDRGGLGCNEDSISMTTDLEMYGTNILEIINELVPAA